MRRAKFILLMAVFVPGCSSCMSNRGAAGDGASPSGGGSGNASGGGGNAGSSGDGIPDFVLYDAGNGLGSPTYGLHVDTDGVYWLQKNKNIYRGSHDGRQPAQVFGQIRTQYMDTMAGDAKRLYWLEGERVRFKDKVDGSEGEIPLPWDHDGGAMAIDDKYLYLAMVGCPAISRIDKQTLVRDELDIPNVALDPHGGGTTLLLRDGGFYCGAWTSVFWVPGWDQPAKRLVSTAVRLAGLWPVADSLFWINDPGWSSTRTTYVSRLALATSTVTDFPQVPDRGATALVASPDDAWLFAATSTILHAISTKDGRHVEVLPPDREGRRTTSYFMREFTADADALYFVATRVLADGQHYGVHRVPFSYLLQRLQN